MIRILLNASLGIIHLGISTLKSNILSVVDSQSHFTFSFIKAEWFFLKTQRREKVSRRHLKTSTDTSIVN